MKIYHYYLAGFFPLIGENDKILKNGGKHPFPTAVGIGRKVSSGRFSFSYDKNNNKRKVP